MIVLLSTSLGLIFLYVLIYVCSPHCTHMRMSSLQSSYIVTFEYMYGALWASTARIVSGDTKNIINVCLGVFSS